MTLKHKTEYEQALELVGFLLSIRKDDSLIDDKYVLAVKVADYLNISKDVAISAVEECLRGLYYEDLENNEELDDSVPIMGYEIPIDMSEDTYNRLLWMGLQEIVHDKDALVRYAAEKALCSAIDKNKIDSNS